MIGEGGRELQCVTPPSLHLELPLNHVVVSVETTRGRDGYMYCTKGLNLVRRTTKFSIHETATPRDRSQISRRLSEVTGKFGSAAVFLHGSTNSDPL